MLPNALILTLALVSVWPCSLAAQPGEKGHSMRRAVAIRIGEKSFAITLADTAAAAAFEKRLPLSITMTELNGNEKFARVPTLPARASTPPFIHTGDVMLYGSDTLVLFYKSFSTQYSYTKIGQVNDPAGLEDALGSGDVVVAFEAMREKP